MSYVLPTFNLHVNIWRLRGVGGAYATPDVATLGNLTPGRRVEHVTGIPTAVLSTGNMELLLPKLTDIRCIWNGIQADFVEVPAGSKRFYDVRFVDDIGKGFANEHRYAILSYIPQGAAVFGFTAPVPLP